MPAIPPIRGVVLAGFVAFAPAADGAPTLHAGFDGASLKVSTSTVSGNNITLVPRATWTVSPYTNRFRNVTFRVEDALATKPAFRVFKSPLRFLGNLSGHRFVYSYDQVQWFFFDNNTQFDNSPTDFRFSNNTAFTQNTVYVSWSIPYPVSRARAMVDALAASSPHVRPAASADSQFVIGYGAGGTTELGATVPPQELLGAEISDERIAGPQKKKVVLVSGVHSGETYGNLTLEGFLEFATGGDPMAVELRERAVLYIYPLVNPDGRYGGFYRSGPENPSLDYNRYWDDPSGFTDLTIARNSMISDTGGDIDMLLDFHCHFDSPVDHYLYANNISNTGFVAQLLLLRPSMDLYDIGLDPGDPPEGYLDSWAGHPLGLDGEFVGTPESSPGLAEQEYLDLGRDYAIALLLSLGDNDSDDDNLPDYWELTHAASLAVMGTASDTDHDGRLDAEEWLEATDPADPADRFAFECTPAGATVQIAWEGHAGRTYAIEESATLLPGSWSPVAGSPLPGVDGPMSRLLASAAPAARYFRIVTAMKE